MNDSVKIAFIVMAGIVFLALIGVVMYFQIKPAQTVSVTGTGEVKAVPDLISIYFNIETEADSAQEAKDENSKIVDDVITALVRKGLERKDITTQSFNVRQKYSWENQEGYVAIHRLRVVLDEDMMDNAGEIIDAGVDNGAGISYINFELSQDLQNKYKKQALEKATQDAKSKAEGIAAGLGKKLGRIVSVKSFDFYYSPWKLYEGAVAGEAKQAVTDIQPGEKSISGRVEVIYALK